MGVGVGGCVSLGVFYIVFYIVLQMGKMLKRGVGVGLGGFWRGLIFGGVLKFGNQVLSVDGMW